MSAQREGDVEVDDAFPMALVPPTTTAATNEDEITQGDLTKDLVYDNNAIVGASAEGDTAQEERIQDNEYVAVDGGEYDGGLHEIEEAERYAAPVVVGEDGTALVGNDDYHQQGDGSAGQRDLAMEELMAEEEKLLAAAGGADEVAVEDDEDEDGEPVSLGEFLATSGAEPLDQSIAGAVVDNAIDVDDDEDHDGNRTATTSERAPVPAAPFATSRVKKLLKTHGSTSRIITAEAVSHTSQATAMILADLAKTAATIATARRGGKNAKKKSSAGDNEPPKPVTVTYEDLAEAVAKFDRFSYLADVIPLPERHGGGGAHGAGAAGGAAGGKRQQTLFQSMGIAKK